MKNAAQFWSVIAGTLVLWVAVAGVLVYNYKTDHTNPELTAEQRSQHENALYAIAGVFVLFNGAMTLLRLQQIKRTRPPKLDDENSKDGF